jgi:hypothetical protein
VRDYQQTKLYDWEQTLPRGGMIKIDNAQAIVNHIWETEQLTFPPQVGLINQRTTRWAGKANRLKIYLQPTVSLRVIIHEMAHSMTADLDNERGSMMHGPWFVGVYVKLLAKYLNVPLPTMLYTLNKYGVDFDINAYPIFLD